MGTVTLNSITGISPYNIYVCDGLGNNCIFLGTITTTPKTFDLPIMYDNAPIVMLKIVDGQGCITTMDFLCVFVTPTPTGPTPTPSTSPTATPTPSPTGPTPTPSSTPTATPTPTPTPSPTDIIVLLRDNVPGDWIGISQPDEDFIFLTD